MEGVLTYDPEDALIRGQIPLQIFKEHLNKIDETKIKSIDFSRNGYCNDAVLKLLCTEKKKNYENLETIFLIGCTLITNAGIKWLVRLVEGASNLKKIRLDGIQELSDNELSLLLKGTSPTCKIYMRGTSVTFSSSPGGRSVNVDGCPLISNQKAKELCKNAHALVIPHESVEHSLTEYVDSKKLTKRQNLDRKTIEVGDWNWNFTEMSLNHPLLDCVLNSNLPQVIIPVGESAVLKEVIQHVTDTISRTVTKMAFASEYLKNDEKAAQKLHTVEVDDFITPHTVCKQQLDDDVLGNYCYQSEILGCMVSGTPFTRSNPYFEVELVESKLMESGGEKVQKNLFSDDYDSDDSDLSGFGDIKSGVLIGCLYEKLFSCPNPLEIDVDKGGEVATFDFLKGKRFGFGIHGDWMSEYIPAKNAKFFATVDGVENNKDLTGTEVPQEMLLPLIACLGDKDNASRIRINNMVKPPQELVDKWTKEKKWMRKAYTKNALIDVNGVMSHIGSSTKSGTFVSLESIEDEFSVKILDRGNFGKVTIALSPVEEKGKELDKNKSWIFEGVTGEVLSLEETKYLVDPGRVESGDLLTIKLEDGPNPSTKRVVLLKNEQRIAETQYRPQMNVDRSVVKLHIVMEDAKVKVQLMNYRPKYRGPILFPESHTVGRLHTMEVSNDGILSQKKGDGRFKFTDIDDSEDGGDGNHTCAYIAKSPLSSKVLSFEVESCDFKPEEKELSTVYVGVSHFDIMQEQAGTRSKPMTHFALSGGTAVLSSKGRLYGETEKGVVKKEGMTFTKGEKIKCEVLSVPPADKLEFDMDGNIVPQQDVLIRFFVNDVLVCDYTMTVRSEGLYPAVFMDDYDHMKTSGSNVKIHNFYAETTENRTKANLQKSIKAKKKKDDENTKKEAVACPEFQDCQYIVVEVGKTASKLQLIEDHLKEEKFSSTLENLTKSIEHYEKNFRTMDLNDQSKYAKLCEAREKIQNLVDRPKRISYMSLDMAGNKGLDKLLEKMSAIMDCRKIHQESKFVLPKQSVQNLALVKDVISKHEIIEFGPGLQNNILDQKELTVNGHVFLQNVKLLHEQGSVFLIQLSSKTVIVDPNFFKRAMEVLDKISTMEYAGKLSTAINESSHIWREEAVSSLLVDWNSKIKEQIPKLLEIFQEYTGLIELPAWRSTPNDNHFMYTTLESLSAPPVPLRDFWSKGDNTKDFIVMQKTFSFIHPILDHILSALLSAAAKYGRTLLLTPKGGAFQIGCVQTVVASHQGLMDLKFSELQPSFENTVISIESKCYIPDRKTGPVDELTEVYVREYTWNIFCLYTDMLEKILKQRNIVSMVSGDYPTNLVNISVGCKHCWKQIPGKANQSVCTMCNKCCDLGRKCQYNGLMGDNLRECLCKTSASGCIDCGICIDCASKLWSTRSYLRPLPMTEMEPKSKPSDVKKDDSTDDGSGVKTDGSTEVKKANTEDLNRISYYKIPLDPISYDEVEIQHLSGGKMGLTLLEVDDGSTVSVFPGKATYMSMDETDKNTTIGDKIALFNKTVADAKYKHSDLNSLTIRLSDPYRCITRPGESMNVSGIQESRVVYHACMSREMTVSHETGLLCYNSASSSVPVAQFIGARPFSENFKKMSIKIISKGEKCTIGIGICPGKTYPANRMPGWNRWSIAYHADDGGIFIEAGFANSHVVKCEEGDIMSLYCDVVTRQLVFYKNDVEVKQIKINVPRGGYWPAVGMHSVGECVKLLEKDAWTPEPEEVPQKPQAFNTYKYGNLWISPARSVSLTKKGYSHVYCGWFILHNPTKFIIGYVISPDDLVPGTCVGSIQPNETVPLFIKNKNANPNESVTIKWISVEQVKEYTIDQIKALFAASSDSSTYSHKLALTVKDSSLGDVDALQQFVDVDHQMYKELKNKDGYKLEVFKNSILVDSYFIKRGRYMLSMVYLEKQTPPDYIIKRPKCPSFLYPPTLQKGIKVVVKLDDDMDSNDQFADAVISEIYEGGGFCFEYTPPGKSSENEKICIGSLACGIDDVDWEEIVKKGTKEDMKIRLLSSHSNTSLLDRTYVPAPPYLVTKGSGEALEMIDPEWKSTTLFTFSACGQSITRPTVQEQIITTHSRKLLKWLSFRDASLPWSVILLPSQLNSSTLKYPVAKNMFSTVDVHRLCFFQDAYIDMTKMPMVFPSKIKTYPEVRSLYDDINIHSIAINDGVDERTYPLKQPKEVCLHVMDLPGFKVQGLIPVDLSYGCLYQAWTYVALLTHKLLLPSYTKLFTDGLGDMDRKQVEALLFQLLQPYASLCSLYAAQYGGLANQENPTYLSQKIQDLCGGDGQPIPMELLGKGMISSNHTFVKFPPFLACKAHSHSKVDKNIVRIKDFSLEAKYYQPYSEKLDILLVNGHEMKSLPSNLFEIFENLQVLTILDVKLSDTPEFPAGIARCKDLEILILSGLPGVKRMAADILTAPALSTFYLHNCPIKTLNIDWPPSETLTSLSLKGLLISEVPAQIGNLLELQELNLDYNPITTLPEELKNLKKLKYLSVKGIPWIAFEGRFDQMPRASFDQWNLEQPYIVNYLSAEVVNELFDQFDVNSNNILDPNEVANLNYEFLTRIPRLGVTKMDDTVFGGVPEVIFSLKTLETLDLSFTGINSIPDLASQLFTLQTLNLGHCPFLESVSGNVGLLPNLKSLHLNSCPVLDSPPPDIVGRGFDSVRAFLKKMAGGYTECHRTKLMFIGLGQAGKTTLLQALKSPLKKTPGTQDAKLTDGIEIKPWVVPVKDQYEITYSCWDFAGQTVYYNTHQFFLSKQAVYMLLWNMRMGFEHAGLDFWLSSIACHCPDTPVIVVGTQLDQIPMPDIPEKELMKKYPQIKKFCYVSSTQGTNIAELEEALINVTMTYCSQMTLKIPKVWLNFEECILVERKRGKNILDWEVLKQYAIDNGIYDEKDIRLAVQFLDDLGTVQYFDTEVLRDRVVINPQWIVDVMAKVVSVNEKSIKESKGRFYHKTISEIWKQYDSSLHEWMLKLTERFDLTFPLPDSEESCNVVPCLLPEEEPEDLPWPVIKDMENMRESKIQYKFAYLPTGLFNRAQARLFSQGFTDTKLLEFLWKKGSILKKNNHYALVKQTSDYEMIVTVQGPRPKNVLDLIHETISTLIKDSFQGVEYDFYIPCPDCVEKEGTKDPFLFKVDLISRAHSVNAPFLQCTKYFHTVSIGELLNIIPDNREREFDEQIQESISSLQEIRDNMTTDVAILYSPEDIPPEGKGEEMVDPREIHRDLLTAGFSCWFPKNLEETSEADIELALKSSKVLVVCMSKNFCFNSKCEQTCMHAITALYKPLAMAIIDDSENWKSTQLGFKIGNPKMAMIKNKGRYKKKMEDLVDIITKHIEDVEKQNLESHPPVFISYCWANSREACSNTTVPKEGSLGFGDPRALKKHLEKQDIKCWIDFEQMGKLGLYQDITVGLQNSRVIVLCVSDEYLQSDACMMEARFAAYNLQLPLVVCVVGTGKAWKMSEVSLMIQKYKDLATVIKMQKESDDVYDRALACVRSYLDRPGTEKQQKIQEKLAKERRKMEQQRKEELEKKLKSGGDTTFSFHEEIELIQRKVMRHIIKITRVDDLENELPKLLVFDFVKKDTTQKKPEKDETSSQNNERPMTSQSLRARTSSKLSSSLSRDKMKAMTLEELEDDWQGEDFCIRVLCEDEQGWHLVGEPLSLISRTSEEVYKALKDASPYLARIYAVLKQSAIPLNCLNSSKGESFLSYIRKEGIGTKNFSDAYKVIHKIVAESEDKDQFINLLNRCYLQSGKISWLCKEHQNKGGITQLQAGSSSVLGTSRTLIFEEDVLLKELLQASPLYAEKTKGRMGLQKEKSTVKSMSNLKNEKVVKKEPKKETEKKVEPLMNEQEQDMPKKKKSDKTVTISDQTTRIPSAKKSRPSSETSNGSQSVTSTGTSNSARQLSRRKTQRKTTSQACSIQ